MGGRRTAVKQLEQAIRERRDEVHQRIDRLLAKSPASRQRVVEAMLGDLEATRAWPRLTTAKQERVEALISGVHNQSAGTSRAALSKLLHSREFVRARADKQQRLLEQSLTQDVSLPATVPAFLMNPHVGRLRIVEATENKYHYFRNSIEPGYVLKLDIGGDRITFTAPTSIGQVRIERVLTALTLLPPIARPHVKTIIMEPERNGFDRSWAKMFKMRRFRSAMTANGDTIQIYPREELWRPGRLAMVLMHEAGHNWSFTHLGPEGHRAWDRWKKVMKADELSPSQYAKKTPCEDFAETFALYFGTLDTPAHDEYRRMFPKRFRFIDQAVVEAAR